MPQTFMPIQQRRQRDHEKFMAFEYDRIRTDEVTDASERLALPMRNTFSYELGKDGELWFHGERIVDILDKGIETGKQIVETNPLFMVELARRFIERQEYEEQKRLASGETEHDVMVVLSPLPDAVLGGAKLGAYDTERKKTLVRVYQRSESGIDATSLSLDLSDREGLNAVANRFGKTIADDATSEDILAMRFWGDIEKLPAGPVEVVRRDYDTALTRKFGGRWYAGRQDSEVLDAMDFINQQHELVSDHLAEIDRLKKESSGGNLNTLLENARYNFAAALTRRLRGDADADSLSDAGAIARSNGEVHTGDCPTGVNITASQSLESLGLLRREWKDGTCRVCQQNGKIGECNVCKNCEDADNRGEDLSLIAIRSKRQRSHSQSVVSTPSALPTRIQRESDEKHIQQKYGQYAVQKKEITLGGQDTIIYDRRSGETIVKL